MRWAFGLTVLVATACGSGGGPTVQSEAPRTARARQTEDDAIIAIDARIEEGKLVFRVQSCGTREPTPVYALMITRKEPHFGCVLKLAGGPDIWESWRYGESLPGYDVSGCEPLEPGPPYQVSVIGGGRGAAGLSIGPGDKLQMMGEDCKYQARSPR